MTAREAQQKTIDRLVAAGIESGEARHEARLLLMRAASLTREQLFYGRVAQLPARALTQLDELVARREKREPLAYIFGENGFYGLMFRVTPAVLIPRPETELLVEAVLTFIQELPAPVVADIGTGSGCIAVAIAANSPARVFATEISPDALAVARDNAERNQVAERIAFREGDWLAPLPPDVLLDAIVSNPPYVSPVELEEAQPEVRDWEPRVALGERSDALHFYRRLISEAPPYLKPGGLLAVEVGLGQADAVAELWRDAGLHSVTVTDDYAGIPRLVAGRKPHKP